MVLPRPLHRSGLASMRRRVTLRAGLIPQTMRVAMPSTPSNFRIRSVTGVVSLMYSILMEDPPHVLGNDGHPWGSGDRFGCCSPSLSPSYRPSGIISAGGSLHEEKNVIGWSWADGGRVGRSCRICCPDTHERSDGHAGDQWHDLRFLRCRSAVCAAISEGCKGSESVVGNERGGGDIRSRCRQGGRFDQGGESRSGDACLRREDQEEVKKASKVMALRALAHLPENLR